jgi:hypothetical protein
MNFHLIWNDKKGFMDSTKHPLSDKLVIRIKNCISSIVKHHPGSKINFYSNTLEDSFQTQLKDQFNNIEFHSIQLEEYLKNTPLENKHEELKALFNGENGVVSYSDLLRLLILYREGGIYMDCNDSIVLKSLDKFENAIGWEHQGTLGNAVMIFEKENPFLKVCLERFLSVKNDQWGAHGPHLLTSTYSALGQLLNYDIPVSYFYPVSWQKWKLLYMENLHSSFREPLINFIENNTYVLSYFGTSQNVNESSISPDSVIGYFLEKV